MPDRLTVAVWMVILPGGVLPGAFEFRSTSMKIKLFGEATQVSGVVAPRVLLTLVMFSW